MKRKAVVSIVLAAALLAACSSSQTGKTGSAASSEKSAEANETKGSEVLDPSTITDDEDTLRDAVDSQTEDLKNRLTVQSQTLTSEIDSYDAYKENVDKVEEFYDTVVTETNKTLILLRKDSSAYAAALLASDRDQDDIYNDLDDIVDDVYDGGCDDISDDIYDGLMDDMRDAFYDGVLDDSDVTDDYAQLYGIPEGVGITAVADGSAAQKAGLQRGDIITKIGDKKVTSAEDLISELEYYAAGDQVTITYQRSGDSGSYEEKTATVTLESESDAQAGTGSSDNSGFGSSKDSGDGSLYQQIIGSDASRAD